MRDEDRTILPQDVEASKRALGMRSMTRAELTGLITAHEAARLNLRMDKGKPVTCAPYWPFASRVIVEAARQERVSSRFSRETMSRLGKEPDQ